MVGSATAIALDGRERCHVQSATRRGYTRSKARVDDRLVRTHTRNMSKMTTILKKTKKSHELPNPSKRKQKKRRVRSIFGSSLEGEAWGIRLGCVRFRRTSNIVWRRRCGARCKLTIRVLVYDSCSIDVLVKYSSRQCGRLSTSSHQHFLPSSHEEISERIRKRREKEEKMGGGKEG
jgi:hypothetical protein